MQNEETHSQQYLSYNKTLSLSPYSESRFVMKHQDLINRHALCVTRLREAAREVESIREENATLRSVNRDLKEQVRYIMNRSVSSDEYDRRALEIVNEFKKLSCGGGGGGGGRGGGEDFGEEESPTSVIERRSDEAERNWLPKSISVRSNGYLKLTHIPSPSTTNTRPSISASLNPAQKVYVKGGKKEEEPMEVQVYNQGMFKTELCNKWQETGACPYADHCQFAHGIEELRPVIRHPRYKTEICRMVLAGDICPYGHRCHFRHALTDQEKLIANLSSPTTLHTSHLK